MRKAVERVARKTLTTVAYIAVWACGGLKYEELGND